MLINASRLIACPVLSLHVGGKVAEVVELIVDPNNLKVIAFRVEGPLVGEKVGNILPIDSIREYSRLGIIIDSADEFIDAEEIVKIQNILKLNFAMIGLKVETKKGSKIGKVSDYILQTSNWQVQQLVVQRPLIKSFLDPELTIHRSRIIEINDYKIIIKDEKEKAKQTSLPTKKDFSPSFVNPFREPDFASESKTTKE